MVGMVGSLSADELGDAVAGIGSDFLAHHLLVGAAVDDAVAGADGVSLADDQVVVAVPEPDGVAAHAVGVARAVPVFVVGDGDIAGHFQESGVGPFEEFGATEGVAFHDFTLFDVEGALFADKGVGEGDFADVVHRGGSEDEFLVGFGPADVAGDDAGVVADTLDVSAGFVVFVDGGPG